MERYSLIVIADETAPIRRIDVRKSLVRRGIWIAGIAACLLVVGLVDYVRVRVERGTLEALRAENADQRAQIERFGQTLSDVQSNLDRVQNLERKIRIIANLPGSAATGGEEVTAVGPSGAGDATEAPRDDAAIDVSEDGAEEAGPPVGSAIPEAPDGPSPRGVSGAAAKSTRARMSLMRRDAERLAGIALERALSLDDLLVGLEDKRDRLASMPSIWPTTGWLTSRFGNRLSPFTGFPQFHAGIDIAGEPGTDVIAPGRGRVTFTGKRGPLGRSVTIDHGYGVRTVYGHIDKLYVKRGQEVERTQVIATLGNTGRSTGPHLHYAVEVHGKTVNPLDYIFD